MQYTLYSLLRKHGENVSEKIRKIISWVTYKTETAIFEQKKETLTLRTKSEIVGYTYPESKVAHKF